MKIRTILLIPADRWVEEINERNNIRVSGTACEGYEQPTFVDLAETAQPDTLMPGLPDSYDSLVACYLVDNNGDSVIDTDDSLYYVYAAGYRLHAVNAETGDTLFQSVPVDALTGHQLLVDDFTGDGIPEIISGSAMYTTGGTILYDFSSVALSPPLPLSPSIDVNGDGDADSVAIIDSCVTIWSGRDTTLLYVNPFTQWTGQQDAVTVGVLADVVKGSFNCYDLNVSYPRYSATQSDTVDLTVRLANSGAFGVKAGVIVKVFADTSSDSNMQPSGPVPTNALLVGMQATTGQLLSQAYIDMTLSAVLTTGTKRIWLTVDQGNAVFECNEGNNTIVLGIQ